MSSLRVEITRRAGREIEAAVAWWRENRPAAPNAVREDLEQVLELLATQPRVGAKAAGTRLAGVRRIHLPRIRYYLYYRLTKDGMVVQVLGLWHSSRGREPRL